MKKLNLGVLAATLILSMATPAMAVRRHKALQLTGEVTEAKSTSITVRGRKTETISVPTGTPIKGSGGGASASLSDLVGKRVTIKEKSPGIAEEITVQGLKKGKKTKSASATAT